MESRLDELSVDCEKRLTEHDEMLERLTNRVRAVEHDVEELAQLRFRVASLADELEALNKSVCVSIA